MGTEIVVKKYGGNSLDSPEKIVSIAGKIAAAGREERIIVIVSAMGQTTDGLLSLAGRISDDPPRRELDMLLTAGERITMSLLSMALNDMGVPAISFTGSQSGIITSLQHNEAMIEEIRAERILSALEEGKVTIVAGFQGVSRAKEVTTLGRGGSDTTAVALASKLGASRCEIYSDFTGLFSADPRRMRNVRRVPRISHDEMVELAAMGARVLHYRAADLARRGKVVLELLSSSEDSPGTRVGGPGRMEQPEVRSVTFEEKAGLLRVETEAGGEAEHRIMAIVVSIEPRPLHLQTSYESNSSTLLCVGEEEALARLVDRIKGESIHTRAMEFSDGLSTVSAVGVGFARRSEAMDLVHRALQKESIQPLFSWSTPLSVSVVVPRDSLQRALSTIHDSLVGDPDLFSRDG